MELRWKADAEKSGGSSVFGRFFGPSAVPARDMAAGLKLSDITGIIKGIHTDVLLRAKLVDPGSCVSIVTSARTLDLTLASHAERNGFIANLRELLNDHFPRNKVSFS